MNSIQVKALHENPRFASLLESIELIDDPRVNRRKKHSLKNIIVIALCAMIGGANTCVAMEHFGRNHYSWFRQFLDLRNGIPSHDTFSRVFSLIDPFQFQSCLMLWLKYAHDQDKVDYIKLDGKAIKALSPLCFIRAWSEAYNMVLAQVKVSSKSNEIKALPDLIKRLDLEGKIVSIDAIGAQKKIVKYLQQKGANYVIALKLNQRSLYHDTKLYFDEITKDMVYKQIDNYYEIIEKDHGRIERRSCWVTKDISWLDQKVKWAGLKSLCLVESSVTVGLKTTISRRYYISSLDENAQTMLRLIRNHWHIENKLHWKLDVIFEEDRSTIRKGNAAQNMALLRSLCITLLKRGSEKLSTSIKRAKAACNLPFLLNVLLA
jgi:predicted transposase YbfD/YdcC